MMNSSADDDVFGDNPFRSGNNNNTDEDDFFTAPVPTSPPHQQDPLQNQQQQNPTYMQQPPPVQQQQQFQPQMMQQQQQQFSPQQQQQFQPQPQQFQQQPPPPQSAFPPPSGPMQQQQVVQLQHQNSSGSSGMMQPPVNRSWWQSCMMCLTLDSYRMYFDIDAEDIVVRVKSAMMDFYKPEHFRNNVLGVSRTDTLKGPDLYGPFWLTMTLIFFIGVTANMHHFMYRNDIDEFDYDINHLLHAATVLCSYSFVLPAVFWITTQCMGMQPLLLVEWVCLYGYSLVPFLPAVIICIAPISIVSWVFLAAATTVSCSLVVRNVAVPLLSTDVGQAKAPPIILAILGSHVIFFLFLKFQFYHVTSSSKSSSSGGGD